MALALKEGEGEPGTGTGILQLRDESLGDEQGVFDAAGGFRTKAFRNLTASQHADFEFAIEQTADYFFGTQIPHVPLHHWPDLPGICERGDCDPGLETFAAADPDGLQGSATVCSEAGQA